MSGMPTVNNLPYRLPTDTRGQLRELAKILNIAPSLVENTGERGIEALCAVILYRHMDQRERHDALKAIHGVGKPELIGKLVTRAVDTTFVNKGWGLWSMTNDELAQDQYFHEAVQAVGGFLGVSFSAIGAREFVREISSQRRLTKDGLATIVIWLSFASSYSRLNKISTEMDRRTQLRESSFH